PGDAAEVVVDEVLAAELGPGPEEVGVDGAELRPDVFGAVGDEGAGEADAVLGAGGEGGGELAGLAGAALDAVHLVEHDDVGLEVLEGAGEGFAVAGFVVDGDEEPLPRRGGFGFGGLDG